MAASSSSSSDDLVNAPGSVLSYKNLSYSVKTKAGQKQLIDDVSVDIRAGELLAIMVCQTIHVSKFFSNFLFQGPSGAGRSLADPIFRHRY